MIKVGNSNANGKATANGSANGSAHGHSKGANESANLHGTHTGHAFDYGQTADDLTTPYAAPVAPYVPYVPPTAPTEYYAPYVPKYDPEPLPSSTVPAEVFEVPAARERITYDTAASWDTYAFGFLRARGVSNAFDIAKIRRGVERWFTMHPPQLTSDPFAYADAVIDCFRLRPDIPIEAPIAAILQFLSPPTTFR